MNFKVNRFIFQRKAYCQNFLIGEIICAVLDYGASIYGAVADFNSLDGSAFL
jgi:hypothetical protein